MTQSCGVSLSRLSMICPALIFKGEHPKFHEYVVGPVVECRLSRGAKEPKYTRPQNVMYVCTCRPLPLIFVILVLAFLLHFTMWLRLLLIFLPGTSATSLWKHSLIWSLFLVSAPGLAQSPPPPAADHIALLRSNCAYTISTSIFSHPLQLIISVAVAFLSS